MVESSSAATGGIKGMMTKAYWSSRRKKRRKEKAKKKKKKKEEEEEEEETEGSGEVCWKMREIVLAAPSRKHSRFLRPLSPFLLAFRFTLWRSIATPPSSVDVPWKIPACSLLGANRAGLTVSRGVRGVGENFLATSLHVGCGGWNRDGECSVSVELTRPTIFRWSCRFSLCLLSDVLSLAIYLPRIACRSTRVSPVNNYVAALGRRTSFFFFGEILTKLFFLISNLYINLYINLLIYTFNGTNPSWVWIIVRSSMWIFVWLLLRGDFFQISTHELTFAFSLNYLLWLRMIWLRYLRQWGYLSVKFI